jgi:hypothetical protein
MKSRYVKKLGAIASTAVVTFLAFPAMAPAMAAGIPSGLFRDASNNVYLMGQSPAAAVELQYEGLTASRDLKANACGLASLRGTLTTPLPTSFTVSGVVVNVASLPTQLKPGCLTTGQLEEARTANFKTAAGEVVIVASSNAIVSISYDANKIRKAKANTCGFARWSTSQTYPNTGSQLVSFSGGSSTQISDLPMPGGLPVCRLDTLYVPAAWLN